MHDLSLASRRGGSTRVEAARLEAFRAAMRGETLVPGEPGYDQARTVWNGMIDRRPALVARCSGVADVLHCVELARELDLLVSVRSGGHHIAGKAVCDDGLGIDLSRMRGVRVDPGARTARVGPGATLGDLDHETQAFALATPLGINSTTGVAGLTLGGGFGWLTRKLGMAADNLVAADVVTAEGQLLHTSETHEPDLLWGLRGGGGNLGIVTSFEFRLHPVGPEVLAGLVFHPFSAARDVMRHWREVMASAPDELSCFVVARKAPPLPFLPAAWHGREVLVLAMLHAGDPAAAAAATRPLRGYGKPLADVVAPTPYVAFQKALDPLLLPGARNYWKSHNLSSLPDAAIDTFLGHVERLPSPQCELLMAHLGGAAGRVPASATAYPHRDASFVMNVHARWESRQDDEDCTAWARKAFDAMAPYATGGTYVNFMTDDEDRARAAYGANYDRLARLKKRYDPTNLFRMNQNVPPDA
ncbi:MAG TPA: FAD-binding oxidoreductase [Vicinamibacteria bacterium]|nr:FAD-binding oxidoreductase [Vicinamibacteria bacterium]